MNLPLFESFAFASLMFLKAFDYFIIINTEILFNLQDCENSVFAIFIVIPLKIPTKSRPHQQPSSPHLRITLLQSTIGAILQPQTQNYFRFGKKESLVIFALQNLKT